MTSSREIIRKLAAAGWRLKRVTGDHHHFDHPDKPGLVTVKHPTKDLDTTLLKYMEKQAGMKLR
ncbi:type II toxin-antitoxin system HicA family toxin [Desulfolutivibrio sulfoxidireducens]|uniref:type II toxin-antitoxin system HicA family toxin n=1 Tax=Desulfolutivibrio sulfoxidireducens TaxID=2773299 RepID=UPI00159EAB8F|nr:type II toxin-antitoxin system HicA family toxin [Desulfolutivibrio sulfoxidireducens]QLA16009.1 addiction module toxin, HicA family [Desulfolutivibrio sulfoxidireducens]QLA20083.1 addiction module toxin, HicA family [Desulfolutivibrio sulfoxidireducens]